ncbi:MAG: DoxX family protein [Bryobacteraceae bacterium]
MNDSMAQPDHALAPLELSGWKTALSWIGAILIAVIFLVSGLWKITDAPSAAVRMAQARVPEALSLSAAIGFGIAETVGGVLILVPRFRRWGAWLCGLMLVAFLVYMGVFYNTLRGEECNCFPWVRRVVGPAFFIGDAAMLGLAALAGVWAKPSEGKRGAVLVLAAVTVFAFVSYGVAATRQRGVKAPESIAVNGQPYSLVRGKTLIYFFDPECLHCLDAGRRMAKYNWGDTRVVIAPIQQAQFAPDFLRDTGLNAVITSDGPRLRNTFPFVSVPAAAAIVDGYQAAMLLQFEGEQPGAALRALGFIH